MLARLPRIAIASSRHAPDYPNDPDNRPKPFFSSEKEETNMGTETCPQCQGTPTHAAIICGPNGCRETALSCDFCGGFGIVAVEAAERYRKGRALREERVHKLGLTEEQYAHILGGISARELNDIEHGRADMPAHLISRRLWMTNG